MSKFVLLPTQDLSYVQIEAQAYALKAAEQQLLGTLPSDQSDSLKEMLGNLSVLGAQLNNAGCRDHLSYGCYESCGSCRISVSAAKLALEKFIECLPLNNLALYVTVNSEVAEDHDEWNGYEEYTVTRWFVYPMDTYEVNDVACLAALCQKHGVNGLSTTLSFTFLPV